MKQHQQPTDIRRPEREREMDGWTEMRAFRHDDDAYNRRRVYTTTGLRLLRLCAAAMRSGLVAGVSNAAAAAVCSSEGRLLGPAVWLAIGRIHLGTEIYDMRKIRRIRSARRASIAKAAV